MDAPHHSYLGFPRISFRGLFQADVNFLNNTEDAFDSQNYEADKSAWDGDLLVPKAFSGGEPAPVGTGTGGFKFWSPLEIFGGVLPNGQAVPDSDPLLKCRIASNLTTTDAKLVDLHVDNQSISEIFGLHLSFRYPVGDTFRTVLGGSVASTPFTYIVNNKTGHGDTAFIAAYQSILTLDPIPDDLPAELKSSPILQSLLQGGSRLSIKWILDSYTQASNPNGTKTHYGLQNGGRIQGFIGIHGANSPSSFSKRLMLSGDTSIVTNSVLNAPFQVFLDRKQAFVDVSSGWWMTLEKPGVFNLQDIGPIALVQFINNQWQVVSQAVDAATYRANWVVVFSLLPTTVENAPFGIQAQNKIILSEKCDGYYAATDSLVHRAGWGTDIKFDVSVSQWGIPVARGKLNVETSTMTIQPPAIPPVTKYTFDITGGKATVELKNLQYTTTVKPFLPGDVWNIVFTSLTVGDSDAIIPLAQNRANFGVGDASVLVFRDIEEKPTPTWDDVKAVFEQYYYIYGSMSKLLNLNIEDSVKQNAQRMHEVMSLPFDNPRFMPVTRDVSPKMTKMILTWLQAQIQPPKAHQFPHQKRSEALAKPNPTETIMHQWPPITTIEQLRSALQQMIELEHATIPLYLTGMWTLKDGQAKNLVRSVVMEEMGHMAIAANLLSAVGGTPCFTSPSFIPTWPGKLPYGVEPELTFHLQGFNKEQLEAFVRLESSQDPSEKTIGAAYNTIKHGLKHLVKKGEKVFVENSRQVPMYGLTITDLKSAKKAIREIVEQGEGSGPLHHTTDPFVTVEGLPKELAHYYKFKEILEGHELRYDPQTKVITYDGPAITYETVTTLPNPSVKKIQELANLYPEGKDAIEFALARMISCNDIYSRMLNALEQTWTQDTSKFTEAVGLMKAFSIQSQQLIEMDVPGLGFGILHLTPSFEPHVELLQQEIPQCPVARKLRPTPQNKTVAMEAIHKMQKARTQVDK